MILLVLAKKGARKSSLLRRLVYRRLEQNPKCTIFWHDPAAQVRGGAVFTSTSQALEHFRARGLPRLAIFRGVEVEDLAALALRVHDVTLVLDELDRACTGKAWRSKSARRIVHEGRHERVDLWGTFRSTRNVHEDLLGQADVVFIGRHAESGYYDLQILRQRFGPAIAEMAQQLEPGEFVQWADE